MKSFLALPQGIRFKKFLSDLKNEVAEDGISNGAAALAYYLMLSIFPAMIFLLSLLPFLPIANLDTAIMDALKQMLPGDAATMFTGVVQEVTSNQRGGLLSVGALLTLWAASNGMVAVMQQINMTYDVKEGRGFLKVRGTAILLTALFGGLVIGAFALIVFGGKLQEFLATELGFAQPILIAFALLRWAVIATALLLGFAFTYYLGPDVEQKFKFISPGSVIGMLLFLVVSMGFRIYVENFGSYGATYGSIGAVIVMMLWLYITGLVVLMGSEINALIEHYSVEGKAKGQKQEPRVLRAV